MPADSTPAFCLFDTAVGACALVWRAGGIVGVLLPEPTDAATRLKARRRYPGAAEAATTPELQRVIERIRGLLDGGRDDLEDIALDLREIPAFNRRVYEITRAIHPGRTRSYGEIAVELGEPHAARATWRSSSRSGCASRASACGRPDGESRLARRSHHAC